MKTKNLVCACLLWALCAVGASAEDAPDTRPGGRTLHVVNEHIVNHQYRRAIAILDSALMHFPGNTDLHSLRVVLYYTWLDDYGTVDSLGGFFLDAVDSSLVCARRDIESNPDDAYAHFARGSALAYRAIYNSYTEGIGLRTIPGLLRDATGGVKSLKRARSADTSFADPLIGVGKYLHWKATHFPWPFATKADRREGVRLLEEAIRRGVRFGGGAEQTLGWVLMSERRYDDAIALAEPLILKYPGSRFFRDIVARAKMHSGDLEGARAGYQYIMDHLSPEERASNFIVMKHERYLALIDQREGKHRDACLRAARLNRLDYSAAHRDWMRRKFDTVTDVMMESPKSHESAAAVTAPAGPYLRKAPSSVSVGIYFLV